MSIRPSLQPLVASTSRYASTSARSAARPPAAAVVATAASSSKLASSASTRSASTSASPSPHSASSDGNRVYTERKTYLYNYYAHLLETSQLVLLFQHANLSVADLSKIRRGIAKIPPPTRSDGKPEEAASVTILRTGLLSALTRHQALPFPALKGQTAMIASPTLSPRYISQILTSITRSIKQSQREGLKGEEVKQPELKLSFGFLEKGKLMDVQAVDKVAKLPELDGLRSQLVGLLEMRGRELVGVLGQAGGGGLVRTLQGLENGLKESAGEASAEA